MGGEAQNADAIVSRIRAQAAAEEFRVTQHAQEEMVAESILLANVLEAIGSSQLLENYPEHRRGACCLILGTHAQRPSAPYRLYHGGATVDNHNGVRAEATQMGQSRKKRVG